MEKNFWRHKKILITGGKGFVGSWVVNNLIQKRGVKENQIIISDSQKDDLRDFKNAKRLVKNVDIIIHLAADVGGVAYSQTYPATQFRNCLLIDLNIFQAASEEKVKKIVAVSSGVIYSPASPSPLKEDYFLEGLPAKSGYGYGMAKRMTLVLAEIYKMEKGLDTIILIPNNAYGPGQDFNLESGHVIPSLIYKCLTQKQLIVWGDGSPVRDFLYVEDFAEGLLLGAEKLNSLTPINLASGEEISIKKLVNLIVKLTNFKGKIIWDKNKPNGQPIRVLDIKRAQKLLGFQPKWPLEKGLRKTIKWFKKRLKII